VPFSVFHLGNTIIILIFNMGKKNKKNTNEGEPEIRWEDSKAKELLREDIKEGRVPRVAKDPETKKSTMKLKDIYNLRPNTKSMITNDFLLVWHLSAKQ